MRQCHMPLGYRMVGGRILIAPEQAELVKGVFQAYSEGNSMYQLARRLTELGALNANHKPVWNHGTVGKILENRRYLGDEFYPALVEPELFHKVQERRKEKSKELGRIMQPNSFGKRSMFADRLVCGICGQPYRRYVEHCGQPGEKIVWKCKHYINGNKVYCRNVFLVDCQIIDAFMELLRLLKGGRFRLEPEAATQGLPYSREAAELNRKLQALEEEPGYPAKEMVQVIYERARSQYRVARIRDHDYQTEKLKTVLKEVVLTEEFDSRLFQTIIRRIVIHEDRRFEFELINRVKIELPIGEVVEGRRLDAPVQNSNRSKETYICDTAQSRE
ncbi:recombinase family protein [[Clostridium] symbiosum]|uniref:recombinase family protein n=1 Tax=Clostridium symbiosum TaxID=1512 RepID=UPI0032C153EA